MPFDSNGNWWDEPDYTPTDTFDWSQPVSAPTEPSYDYGADAGELALAAPQVNFNAPEPQPYQPSFEPPPQPAFDWNAPVSAPLPQYGPPAARQPNWQSGGWLVGAVQAPFKPEAYDWWASGQGAKEVQQWIPEQGVYRTPEQALAEYKPPESEVYREWLKEPGMAEKAKEPGIKPYWEVFTAPFRWAGAGVQESVGTLFDPNKSWLEKLALLGKPLEAIGEPAAGYLGLGINAAWGALTGDQRFSEQRSDLAIKQFEQATGEKFDASNPLHVLEAGRALSRQTPPFAQFVGSLFLDPLNLLPGAGIGDDAIKAAEAAVRPVPGPLKAIRELTDIGITDTRTINRLTGHAFELDDASKLYRTAQDAVQNLAGNAIEMDARKTAQYVNDVALASKSPEAYAELARAYGEGVTAKAGQIAVRTLEGIDQPVSRTLTALDDATKAINEGRTIEAATASKYPQAIRDAVTAIEKGKLAGADAIAELNKATKTQIFYDAAELSARNLERIFGKLPQPNAFQRFTSAMRSIEALLYIGLSPVTLGRNWINNKATLLREGINPLLSSEARIANLRRLNPAKAAALQQVADARSQIFATRDAINRAIGQARQGATTSLAGDIKGRVSRLPSLLSLYQKIEQADRALAWETGAMRALHNNWTVGRWIAGMDAATRAAVMKADPSGSLYKSIVTAVEQSGLDAPARSRMVQAALNGKLAGFDFESLAARFSENVGTRISPDGLRAAFGEANLQAGIREMLERVAQRASRGEDYARVVDAETTGLMDALRQQGEAIAQQRARQAATQVARPTASTVAEIARPAPPRVNANMTLEEVTQRIGDLTKRAERITDPKKIEEIAGEIDALVARAAELRAAPTAQKAGVAATSTEAVTKAAPTTAPEMILPARTAQATATEFQDAISRYQAALTPAAQRQARQELLDTISRDLGTPAGVKRTLPTPATQQALPERSVVPFTRENFYPPRQDFSQVLPQDILAELYTRGYTDGQIAKVVDLVQGRVPPVAEQTLNTLGDYLNEIRRTAQESGFFADKEGRFIEPYFMNSVNSMLGLEGNARIKSLSELTASEAGFVLDGIRERAAIGFARMGEALGFKTLSPTALTQRDFAKELFARVRNLTPEQAESVMVVNDAVGRAWAKRTGKTLDDYYREFFAGFKYGKPETTGMMPYRAGEGGILRQDLMPTGEAGKRLRDIAMRIDQLGAQREAARQAGNTLQARLIDTQIEKARQAYREIFERSRGVLRQPANIVAMKDVPTAIKGAVSHLDDSNRMLIWLTSKHDVSTLLHEPAHIWRKTLGEADLKLVGDWAGIKDGMWLDEAEAAYRSMLDKGISPNAPQAKQARALIENARAGEEKWARAIERYFAEGIAPTSELKTVFEKFKEWLIEVYRAIAGSPIDVEISPQVRQVMKRMLDESGVAPTFGRVIEMRGADPNIVYRAQYKVVPLDSLITSHTDNLIANPNYPHEPYGRIQPRLRDRAASQQQIDEIARQLQPNVLLSDTGMLDRGTPIVGADNAVESGNGRTLALRLARDRYPENWKAYQDTLMERAREAGIDPREIAGMKDPVLVRERLGEVDRSTFAAQANESASMSMSTFERALQDAERITDSALADLTVGENQSITQALTSPENRGFIKAYLERIPANERASISTAEGTLNAAGIERIKAGMFAHVYPGEAGNRLAQAFTESVDPGIRNIESALFSSLPEMSKAEGLVKAGLREGELSLADDISKAVDVFARLRERSIPIGDYLSQTSMFPRELTPFQEQLLEYVAANNRNVKPLRDYLSEYARSVQALPPKGQMAMVEFTAPTKEELSYGIFRRQGQEGTAKIPTTLAASTGPSAQAPAAPNPLSTGTAAPLTQSEKLAKPTAGPKQVGTLFQDAYDATKRAAAADMTGQVDFAAEFMRVLREELMASGMPKGIADAQARIAVNRWLDREVGPSAQDAVRAAKKHGDWLEGATVLNPNLRWNADRWSGYFMPFPFWRMHYGAESLRWMADSPRTAILYLKLEKELEKQHNSPEYPARFRGKTFIPMPFLPKWMGGGVFFDLAETAFPYKQVFGLNQYRKTNVYDQEVADTIRGLAKQGAITDQEAQAAITNKDKSKLWVDTQKRMQDILSNENGLGDLFGLHTLYSIGLKIATGKADDIGIIFPFTRYGRAAEASGIPILNVVGKNVAGIEKAVREAMGLKPYEPGYDFHIDRMLANMVADGTTTAKDAQLAMVERKGKVFEEARMRSYQEMAMNSLLPLTYAQIYPSGERAIVGARLQRDVIVDQEFNRLLSQHPELQRKVSNVPAAQQAKAEIPILQSVSDMYGVKPAARTLFENTPHLEGMFGDIYNRLFGAGGTATALPFGRTLFTTWMDDSKVVLHEVSHVWFSNQGRDWQDSFAKQYDALLSEQPNDPLLSMVEANKVQSTKGLFSWNDPTERYAYLIEEVQGDLSKLPPTLRPYYSGWLTGQTKTKPDQMASLLPKVETPPPGTTPTGPVPYTSSEKWDLLKKYNMLGKDSPISKFLNAHPEIGTMSAAYEAPEARMKDLLVGEFWDRYNKMSALDKRIFRQDSKDAALDEFIDKSTRDYSKLTIDKLAEWTKRLNGYVPQAQDLIGFAPEKLAQVKQYAAQDPKLSATYEQWLKAKDSVADDPAYKDYTTRSKQIRDVESGYFAIQNSVQRNAYLKQHPELQAWRDWSKQWKVDHPLLASYQLWEKQWREANPELQKLLYGASEPAAPTKQPSATTSIAKPATTDYAAVLDAAQRSATSNALSQEPHKSAMATRDAIYAKYGDNAKEIEQAYFDAADRRAYLQRYPWLQKLWEEKKAWSAKYPRTQSLLTQLAQGSSGTQAGKPTAGVAGTVPSPTASTRGPNASQAQLNYLQSLGYRGNPNLSAGLASTLIDQYLSRRSMVSAPPSGLVSAPQGSGGQVSYSPPHPNYTYPPRANYVSAPTNKWRELLGKIGTNAELVAALKEYLYQSKAGRPSVMAKYPFLKAFLAGLTEADIDALTADYLITRRLARRPASAPYNNRLPY